MSGASNRNRTCNLLITNQLHCQLCYASGNLFIVARFGSGCQPQRAGLQGAVIGQGKLFGAQAGVKPRGLQRGRDPGFGQAEAGRDGVGGRFAPLGERRADQAEQAALVAVCGLYGRRIMQRQGG